MSRSNYAEKIHEFEGIISGCDQELEELRRNKRYQEAEPRKEVARKKIGALLSLPIFAPSDDIVETWNGLQKEISGVSPRVILATDVPSGDRENPVESQRWYRSEDIFCILDKEVQSRPSVNFSNMILVGEYEHFDPKIAFQGQFEEAVKAAKNGKVTIMPINLGNKHWLGGMMRKNDAGELEFVYNDSLGDPHSEELINLHVQLAQWIRGFDPNIKLVNLGVEQQHDGYNCGPYTIHNLLTLADNKDLSAEELKVKLGELVNPKNLRKRDAEVLAGELVEKDDVEKMWCEVKERAICGKMQNLFGQFKEEGRVEEGGVKCRDEDEARALAEQIKKSYEDLGVKPCSIEQKGDVWVVKLPQECRGRDPFSMGSKELKDLREELQPPSASVKSVFNLPVQGGESQKKGISAGV